MPGVPSALKHSSCLKCQHNTIHYILTYEYNSFEVAYTYVKIVLYPRMFDRDIDLNKFHVLSKQELLLVCWLFAEKTEQNDPRKLVGFSRSRTPNLRGMAFILALNPLSAVRTSDRKVIIIKFPTETKVLFLSPLPQYLEKINRKHLEYIHCVIIRIC